MDRQISDALKWRYATKLFNPQKKIPQAKLHTLLEAVRLAPSSWGLQPWRVLVISDPEVRQKLKTAAWGQPQVTDASQLVVFASQNNMTEEYVDRFISNIANTRGQQASELESLKQMVMGSVKSKSPEEIKEWNAKQVYIPLGMLLTTAALLKVDACPMEGFDKAQFDKILGLKAKHLSSVVMCALGYRSPDDQYAKAAKARFPKNEVIEMI